MPAPLSQARLSQALFRPRSIALVGASADQGKTNSRAQRLLTRAGFAGTGEEGRALQDRIAAIAREGGLRLVGPNCLGLVNVTDGIPITLNAAVEAEPLTPGWLSVVSQSGSMM